MTEQETAIVNNIASKLELLLYKKKITVLALSRLLNIDKQPLYRIIKREHIPNVTFLETIAKFLKCTVIELMSKDFFLDIYVYQSNDIDVQQGREKYRAYVYDENFLRMSDNDFFGIMQEKEIKIFYKVDKVLTDGYYLIQEGNNELKEVNIISVGTNLIIAIINNQETRLNPNTITVTAKLYKTVSVVKNEGHAIKH